MAAATPRAARRPAPLPAANADAPTDAVGIGGCASPRSVGAAPPGTAPAPAAEHSQTDANIIFSSTAAAAHSRLQQPQRDAQRSAAACPRAAAHDGRRHSEYARDERPRARAQSTTQICLAAAMLPYPLHPSLTGLVGTVRPGCHRHQRRPGADDRTRPPPGGTEDHYAFGRDQSTQV